MPETIKVDKQIYKIKKLKIEVQYDDVNEKVEEIWSMDPKLVIHVGVHGQAEKIKLEKCAFNDFPSSDFASKKLLQPVVCLAKNGKCQVLETKINVDKITRHLNENFKSMYESSCDVGKYLCGYIYLKSLDQDPLRTLFIHVPCINKPYSSEETSEAILKVIEQCLTTPILD